jgi:Ca-activated chloride channel family protein
LYDSIVDRARDPALLEFADYDTLRSSVFPVSAGSGQVVKVVYEHVLPTRGDRVDYVLPRSESLAPNWIPWTVEARIRAPRAIAAIYSPTHAMAELRATPSDVRLRLDAAGAREPGPVRVSWLLEGNGLNATLYLQPDAAGRGAYFLLLCGLPPAPADAKKLRREIILVLDRSGSMRGEKFEQARAAAMQILDGIEDGERFNIIDYSSSVALFSAQPVQRSDQALADAKKYLERLAPDGGTDIHGALTCALRQEHAAGTHPIVLFLTDGQPTVGVTDEVQIRNAAAAENDDARRIFTFGVGHDVNAPLLDQIALHSRATSTYVQPAENVEAKVSEVYARLRGPRLTAPELRILDAQGNPAPQRVADLEPRALADLYDGEQILVLGRLRGSEDVVFEIAGQQLGAPATFRFPFRVTSTADDCDFVPRLWASRRIASLLDDLRMSGADPKVALARGTQDGEIAREIYALSTEFGIMTEYTAFLAQEGSVLADEVGNLARMNDQLQNRLRRQRAGREAVVQAVNSQRMRDQERMNRRNRQLDQTLKEKGVRSRRASRSARVLLGQGPLGRLALGEARGRSPARRHDGSRIRPCAARDPRARWWTAGRRLRAGWGRDDRDRRQGRVVPARADSTSPRRRRSRRVAADSVRQRRRREASRSFTASTHVSFLAEGVAAPSRRTRAHCRGSCAPRRPSVSGSPCRASRRRASVAGSRPSLSPALPRRSCILHR